MSAILSGIADGEVIERGGHDLDAFASMTTADENEAELETALQVVLDGVVRRRATSGVFGGGCARVWISQPTAFSEFLKPPRLPLANALGVVVGVVVVRRYGYGNSCGVQNGQRRKH